MGRPSWDKYFMHIANEVSRRATCDRLHVGCVLVDCDRHILATGYNGSFTGLPHCDDAGHDIVEGHCVRTVHAEVNAVAQAARTGRVLAGATAYLTAYPCWSCAKVMASAGVKRVVYRDAYRIDHRVADVFVDDIDQIFPNVTTTEAT